MGHIGGDAQIDLDLPVGEVWAALADVERAADWQDGLDSIEVVERDADGRPQLVRTESDIKVRRIKSLVRFSYEENSSVEWTQIEGDMKSVEGSWHVEDLGDGRTRVRYALDTDPGRVLGLVIRGPVEAATRELFVSRRPGELAKWLERPR
jgi:carbon monoxide dehydrogenase subunit G